MSNLSDFLPLVGGSDVFRIARTGNISLSKDEKGALIDITSGTFTQTFDACSTLGDGWFVYLKNSGTGDITLDPAGSETIDGLTSYIMYPGEVRLIQCDGSALRSIVINSFYKVFDSSGSFIKPPGYSHFDGLIWAGGGSGRKSSATSCFGGGGGGCAPFSYPFNLLSNSESFVIGAGGAAIAANNTSGLKGGDSYFFNAHAFGGIGGNANGANGGYSYFSDVSSLPVIQFANGAASDAFYGGGASGPSLTQYGKTVYGGGAGGSIDDYGTSNKVPPRATIFGGAGGNYGNGVSGQNGTAPGGGGGATNTGALSGAGARGELRIWGVI